MLIAGVKREIGEKSQVRDADRAQKREFRIAVSRIGKDHQIIGRVVCVARLRSHDRRPTAVEPGLHQIDFIKACWSILGGPHAIRHWVKRDPECIANPVGEPLVKCLDRVLNEWVVGGRGAVGSKALRFDTVDPTDA